MLTVGPPRGDGRVFCTMPVTSVPDTDSRMRRLLGERPNVNDRNGLRSEILAAPKRSGSSGNVRPRFSSTSRKTAITDSVNSLWRSLHDGPTIPATVMTVADGDGIVTVPTPLETLRQLSERRRPNSMQEARVDQVQTECSGPDEIRSSDRRIWSLVSETGIAIDGPQEKCRSPDLALRVPALCTLDLDTSSG